MKRSMDVVSCLPLIRLVCVEGGGGGGNVVMMIYVSSVYVVMLLSCMCV